jgi:hypothetical protein
MASEAVKIPFTEAAAPSTPAAGTVVIYAKTDGLLYSKDDAGSETLVSGGAGGGSVATDAIWDAAGDLAVGSGANTAAKLALGNAGALLGRVNGAVAWNAATSFPTAATGDLYHRTDLPCPLWRYDGTRWRCATVHGLELSNWNQTNTGLSGTTSGSLRGAVPPLQGGTDLYILDAILQFYVNGGTALSGSHSWVGTLNKVDSAASDTSLGTYTINSGSSSVYRNLTLNVNALLGTTSFIFQTNFTKTGTPGNLLHYLTLNYQHVST